MEYNVVIETVMGSEIGLTDDVEIDVEVTISMPPPNANPNTHEPELSDMRVKNVVTFGSVTTADVTPHHREQAMEIAADRAFERFV